MYSVSMSVFDFIPVALYGIAVFGLQKDLYSKMSKGVFALFCAGTIDVFIASLLKALYKLLYALGICDFKPLSDMFFPVEALGFFMAGLSMILMLSENKKGKIYAAAAPVLFQGTFVFVIVMVLGVLSFDGCLAIIAGKMKKKGCILLFVVAAIMALMMGYLSSRDFADPMFNWIAEGVNTIGQVMLLLGIKNLKKAGLKEFSLAKEK